MSECCFGFQQQGRVSFGLIYYGLLRSHSVGLSAFVPPSRYKSFSPLPKWLKSLLFLTIRRLLAAIRRYLLVFKKIYEQNANEGDRMNTNRSEALPDFRRSRSLSDLD